MFEWVDASVQRYEWLLDSAHTHQWASDQSTPSAHHLLHIWLFLIVWLHCYTVLFHCYIVCPTVQSEYVADCDKRLQFISGFSGSAGIKPCITFYLYNFKVTKLNNNLNIIWCFCVTGTVVVLQNKAALWTDGRYFLQMEAELDCNWTLMKSGQYIWQIF